ncbi:MAG: DNA replication/repair protein RecF [Oscillospiraceae bacterium]|nr:DNA replication/repair protein RecF [Oscillospiraceae bacterium]
MQINNLYLENFRNYSSQYINFDPTCNVICGENAQGKTNLLEAIICLSTGKSPRTRGDQELTRFGNIGYQIQGHIFTRGRDFISKIESLSNRKKKIFVNKVSVKNFSELSQTLNTIFFCPEDLQLIKEGAAARRHFMDVSLCQLRPNYASALTEYSKLHEHKLRILRDQTDRPDLLQTLPDFNKRLAETGAVLIHYRARFARCLSEYAEITHQECSGGKEKLEILYKTVNTITDPFEKQRVLIPQLEEHLRKHNTTELSSRQCLSGPHKDDLEVLLNGLPARSFASQGQTRTAALSMKLAAREIHREIIGEYPVLLLDDVLSELDPKRQEFVLNRINGGQVFITCCENDRLNQLLKGKVLTVKNGVITE